MKGVNVFIRDLRLRIWRAGGGSVLAAAVMPAGQRIRLKQHPVEVLWRLVVVVVLLVCLRRVQ